MSFLSSILRQPQGFALDFADGAIHLLEVKGKGARNVTAWANAEIPPGVMEDGLILDPPACAEAIRQAYASTLPHPPRTRNVVAELPESQTYLAHFILDRSLRKKALEEAAFQQGERTIPVDFEEYVWDYQVLQTSSTMHEILFAAAPRALVRAYEQTLELAGLKLQVLELESLALTRALVEPSALEGDSAVVVLDIGGRTTLMALLDAAGLRFSLTLPIAGQALTRAIAESLDLSEEEAEKLKIKRGFSDKAAAHALRTALQPVEEELQRMCAEYTLGYGRKAQKVILAGGSSALPGLERELGDKIGLPVACGTVPYTVKGVKPSQMAVVSGLAARAARSAEGLNFLLPK